MNTEEEVPDGPDNRALDLDDLSPNGYAILDHRMEEETPEFSDGIIESHNRWFYETCGGRTRHPEYD